MDNLENSWHCKISRTGEVQTWNHLHKTFYSSVDVVHYRFTFFKLVINLDSICCIDLVHVYTDAFMGRSYQYIQVVH